MTSVATFTGVWRVRCSGRYSEKASATKSNGTIEEEKILENKVKKKQRRIPLRQHTIYFVSTLTEHVASRAFCTQHRKGNERKKMLQQIYIKTTTAYE